MRAICRVAAAEPGAVAAAIGAGADAVVLDIAALGGTRDGTRTDPVVAWPNEMGSRGPWLGLGGWRSGTTEVDLAALLPEAASRAPCGALLADTVGARDVQRLGARLAVLEAERGWDDGAIRILAEIASPAGVLALDTLADASPRLAGLVWDGDAVARALRLNARGEAPAARRREASGEPRPAVRAAHPPDDREAGPVRYGRARAVLVAAAAGLPAFDATADLEDDAEAFARACDRARRDGFAGCVVSRPDRIAAACRVFEHVAREGERGR